jgi:hypothetical protein
MEYDEMTDYDIQREIIKQEEQYDFKKEEKLFMDEKELYERIFTLKDSMYSLEDKLEEIRQFLLKSSLSIEDMEKVGKIYE